MKAVIGLQWRELKGLGHYFNDFLIFFFHKIVYNKICLCMVYVEAGERKLQSGQVK